MQALAAERSTGQWISGDTLGTIDEHCTVRLYLVGNKAMARRLAATRKQHLQRYETDWYRRVADETEEANRAICMLTFRTGSSKQPSVTPKNGSPLCAET